MVAQGDRKRGQGVEIEIDLWLWSLDPPAAQEAEVAALLSDDEEARARAFVRPEHGRAFRVARGRMRQILAGYTGDHPARFGFACNPQGRPWLPGGPVFNLSHAGGWAALAVTARVPLGVDIEACREMEQAVAERFFSPAENAELAALPPAQWLDGFYRCWTRKEALVKACGMGLSMPLDSFDVTLTPGAPARLTRFDRTGHAARDWRMIHLDLGPCMVGAIAVKAMGSPVALTLREGRLPL